VERRDFLKGAASLGAFCGLPRAARAAITLDDPVLPLVRLIEETPRESLVEEVAKRIRAGASYRQVVAALLLAGVRNVRPKPVGFKFHAVMVVHACHQAAQLGPDEDRWLPILWAVDHFKGPQAEEKKATGWTLGAVEEAKVPSPGRMRAAFLDAFERWDEAAGDVAAAALARHAGIQEAFELFARHAARDFRHIGHKSIYVAGAFRLLEVIGWTHAEPVLRSLAQALLTRDGPEGADLPWERSRALQRELPESWRGGKPDDAAVLEMLAACRSASDADAAKRAVDLLQRAVSPRSIWDALHLHAGELLMRRPNILSLHAVTMGNAVRHLYDSTADDETRRLLLLQTASFAPLFRGDPAKLPDVKLDALEAVEAADPEAVLADVPSDRMAAARKALGYLKGGTSSRLVDAARRHLLLKGRDVHDFKFAEAALEDHGKLSPRWRDRYLAASVYWLRGAGSPDNGLVQRIRSAFKG
jgi:hypothetical protein